MFAFDRASKPSNSVISGSGNLVVFCSSPSYLPTKCFDEVLSVKDGVPVEGHPLFSGANKEVKYGKLDPVYNFNSHRPLFIFACANSAASGIGWYRAHHL